MKKLDEMLEAVRARRRKYTQLDAEFDKEKNPYTHHANLRICEELDWMEQLLTEARLANDKVRGGAEER